MNKIVSNKNNVILGLQNENARLVRAKAELQRELDDALKVELSMRANVDAEQGVVDALRDRLHAAEVAAAEAQRDMLARPHRATVERCQEARRESDRIRIEQNLEHHETRKVLYERVRKLRSQNSWLSLYAVVSVIVFSYLALA